MSERTPDVICMARLEVLDLLEELGAVATHLREAYSDFENGNEVGANMCVEDAIEIMGRIERMSAELARPLCQWVEIDEGRRNP